MTFLIQDLSKKTPEWVMGCHKRKVAALFPDNLDCLGYLESDWTIQQSAKKPILRPSADGSP